MSTEPYPASPKLPGAEAIQLEIHAHSEEARRSTSPVRLAIHRVTGTHHGRTLLILGHAAEHLANSRRFDLGRPGENDSDAEAIHILMRLGREIFDDLAGTSSLPRRIEHWVVDRFVGMIC